jgi:peptidoglycan/xylan/chitin deacetylase (PgdA/CDA1 family)
MTILAYHEITPKPSSAYEVSVDQFDQHLDSIARRPVADGDGPPLVTFDDGEQSQYERALPILEKHGVKAMFFVNVGLIGGKATSPEWRQEFMSWAALKELLRLNHQVQSHGWSHKYLTSCSDEELKREIEHSRKSLEDRLGAAVECISFPGGRWNTRVLRRCSEAGYKSVFTSDPWISAVERQGVTVRGRFMVRRSTDTKALRAMLSANPVQLFRLQMQGSLKAAARRLFGENVYHAVWKKLTGREFNTEEANLI